MALNLAQQHEREEAERRARIVAPKTAEEVHAEHEQRRNAAIAKQKERDAERKKMMEFKVDLYEREFAHFSAEEAEREAERLEEEERKRWAMEEFTASVRLLP